MGPRNRTTNGWVGSGEATMKALVHKTGIVGSQDSTPNTPKALPMSEMAEMTLSKYTDPGTRDVHRLRGD